MEITKSKEDVVKACTCTQCCYSKAKKNANVRRWFKRYTNKQRRKNKKHNHFWA